MRRINVFNSVSLDGYFTDSKSDMSWAHEGGDDPEFAAFVAANAKGGGTLVFGRVTFDLMKAYWPTPQAAKDAPDVARQMTALEKIVFSRTMKDSSWENTSVVSDDPVRALAELKEGSGPDIVIMGSGKIIAQAASAGVIDEYQLIFCPIVLGSGRTMFEGLRRPLRFAAGDRRSFNNGKTFIRYVPA